MKYWHHETTKGIFYIIPDQNKFDIMFDDDCLGTYDNPQLAVDDLVGGHTDWPSFGDPSTLDIPEEIGEWQQGESDK